MNLGYHSKRLKINSTEYNTIKSEILSIQQKNYNTKKAKEVTNAILIYANDFTRKRYQIKYAKNIANNLASNRQLKSK